MMADRHPSRPTASTSLAALTLIVRDRTGSNCNCRTRLPSCSCVIVSSGLSSLQLSNTARIRTWCNVDGMVDGVSAGGWWYLFPIGSSHDGSLAKCGVPSRCRGQKTDNVLRFGRSWTKFSKVTATSRLAVSLFCFPGLITSRLEGSGAD